VSASRNLGIIKSTSELICFLDADDVVYSNRFDVSAPILEFKQEIDAVYEMTKIVFDDSSNKDPMADWGTAFFGNHSHDILKIDLLTRLLRGFIWCTSGILCRRALLEKAGLFNMKFNTAEDCNLWFKIACIGRIVHGDMTTPVSEYIRHERNTFWLGMDRRPNMVSAMADACRWGLRKRLPGAVIDTLFTETRAYISDSVAINLQANRAKLAWKIVRAGLKDGGFILFANLRLLRTVAWLCRKTILSP
jgi:hypothetical protein